MMNMHTPAQADTKAGRRFWLAHVRALAESGFSRREYCRHHQLSYDCLTYWVRKHRSGAEPAQLPALVESGVASGNGSATIICGAAVPPGLRLDACATAAMGF